MESSAATVSAVKERPPRLLFVYTWDMLRGVGAILAALTAFAGAEDTTGRVVAVPLWEQILAALGSASYAGSLFVVAALLQRREQWVRRAQMILLLLSAVLIVVSAAIYILASRDNIGPVLIGSTVVLALDAAAVFSLSRPDADRWYIAPSSTPKYISGAVAFWAAISVALLIVDFVR